MTPRLLSALVPASLSGVPGKMKHAAAGFSPLPTGCFRKSSKNAWPADCTFRDVLFSMCRTGGKGFRKTTAQHTQACCTTPCSGYGAIRLAAFAPSHVPQRHTDSRICLMRSWLRARQPSTQKKTSAVFLRQFRQIEPAVSKQHCRMPTCRSHSQKPGIRHRRTAPLPCRRPMVFAVRPPAASARDRTSADAPGHALRSPFTPANPRLCLPDLPGQPAGRTGWSTGPPRPAPPG